MPISRIAIAYRFIGGTSIMVVTNAVRSGGPATSRALRLVRCLGSCTRGAIAPLTALMMIPVVGGIAYAVELGSWQYLQRSAQNAADSAALSAATVADTGGVSTAENEARAAAEKFGFVDGENGATVSSDIATCPTGISASAICYEAVITTSFPLSFSRVLGFTGTDGSSQQISARAVAVSNGGPGGGTAFNPCLWALGDSGVTLSGDGIPAADLEGCGVISAGAINCNGSGTMNADYALAGTGTSSGCAASDEDDISPGDPRWVALPPDPYASLPIPSVTPCGDSPAENLLSSDSSATLIKYCGNVKLTKNVNLTGSNTVLVIANGALDLNGFELKTSGANASTTIIFTGTNTADRQHFPTSSKAKSGTLSIKAPTTGTYANIALMQDKALTNHKYNPGNKNTIDFVYAGNEPTWNISGVAYFPKANTEFKGVIGKYEDNGSCFVLMAYSIAISGTGEIIADNTTEDCEDSGYSIPGVTLPGSVTRPKLVL